MGVVVPGDGLDERGEVGLLFEEESEIAESLVVLSFEALFLEIVGGVEAKNLTLGSANHHHALSVVGAFYCISGTYSSKWQ